MTNFYLSQRKSMLADRLVELSRALSLDQGLSRKPGSAASSPASANILMVAAPCRGSARIRDYIVQASSATFFARGTRAGDRPQAAWGYSRRAVALGVRLSACKSGDGNSAMGPPCGG